MPSIHVGTKHLLRSAYSAYQGKLTLSQQNVTQKDVENYISQDVDMRSASAGGYTYGVKLMSVRQKVNESLFAKLRESNNTLGGLKIAMAYRENINKIFSDKQQQQSLSHLARTMADSLKTYASRATDMVAAQNAVTDMHALTKNIQSMSKSIQQERANADTDIGDTVNTINSLLEKIRQVSTEISVRAESSDGAAFPFINERRDLLQQLSAYIQIDERAYSPLDLKNFELFDIDGNTLIQNNICSQLVFKNTFAFSTLTEGYDVQFVDMSGVQKKYPILNDGRQGALHELVKARDVILPQMQQELDAYTGTLRDTFNQIHNEGLALNPATSMTSFSTVPDGRIIGDGHGSLNLAEDMKLSGSGTVRFAVINLNDGIMQSKFDLELSADMSLGDIINAINDADIGLTASLTEDGKFNIESNDPAFGIAISNGAEGNAPKICANDVYNPTRAFGFSHFFGFSNLFDSDTNVLGDSLDGVSETFRVRKDILTNAKRLATGQLSLKKDISEKVLHVGDVSNLEKLSNALNVGVSFQRNTLVQAQVTTLEGYASGFAKRNITEEHALLTTIQKQNYAFEGLSQQLSDLSGVDEQYELSISLDLVTSISYITRMMSFNKELDEKVLSI